MTTAITALTAPAQTAKNSNANASTESNNADQTSFGALLHQSVSAQNKTADKPAAPSSDKSTTNSATTDAKTDASAKPADQDEDAANAAGTPAQQDATTALLQALAALGLAQTNAAAARPVRTASADKASTGTDGTAGEIDGVVRGASTRASDATTELGANAKNALKNNAAAALARPVAGSADATGANAGKADAAAHGDTEKADLTARLTQALRAATEGETKPAAASTDNNTPTRFADVLGGLNAVNATANSASTANTAPTAQQTIQSPFGSAAWANEVTEQVRSFTLQKIEVAELKLNPQDLGPIRVEIALDKGNAAIHFSAARDDVRDALAQNIGNLRDSLANAGVSLQNASTGNFGDGQAFGYMQRQAANGGGRSGARGDAGGTNDVAGVTAAAASPARRTTADGVDLFA